MRKFLNWIVWLPLGVIFVVFAVANHHEVRVSFDPFNSSDPALSFELPLFVVIIAVAILGVVAGGIATWLGQRHWRRAARRHEADAREAYAGLADLRASLTGSQRRDPGLPVTMQRGALYRRDKQGATL